MKEKLTEYEALKQKALGQFKGKHLLGKDGAFQPLLKEFLEAALPVKYILTFKH
jgi:putative transposase